MSLFGWNLADVGSLYIIRMLAEFIVVMVIAIIKNDYIIFGKKEVLNYYKTIFVYLLIIDNMYINMESQNNFH